MQRVNDTYIEDINPSDNECDLPNDNEGIESTGVGRVRRVMLPSPCAQLSSLFGPLDHFSVSSGYVTVKNRLCKARMPFIEEDAYRLSRQSDVKELCSTLGSFTILQYSTVGVGLVL